MTHYIPFLTLYGALMIDIAWPCYCVNGFIWLLPVCFFWVLHRPAFIHPLMLFFLGLLLDICQGWFLGVSGVLLLLFYKFITRLRYRLMAYNFYAQCCFLLCGSLVIHGLVWAGSAVILGVAESFFYAAALPAMVNGALYPFVSVLLGCLGLTEEA
jgi:cell shape-determining protein MreD